MSGSTCRRGALGLALLIPIMMGTASAEAGYVFTKITDVSGNSVLGNPAINDAGTVVFGESNNTTGEKVIFTGSGGPLTRVADNLGGTYLGFGDPVISAGGSVAFIAGRQSAGGSGLGVFRIDGNATTTITSTVALGGPFVTFDSALSINAGGKVSFTGELFNGGAAGVFASSGGSLTTIASTSGGTYQGFFPSSTSINGAGTVAFNARLSASSSGLFAGSGGGVTTVAQTGGVFGNSFGSPAMNASGTVGFAAGLSGGGQGVFTNSGGTNSKVLDTTSGLYQSINTDTEVGIDGQGHVVFYGLAKGGAGEGIFAGPDPIADKVVVLGDTLDGSTVNFLSFNQNGVNAGGEITFFAGLSDGRSAIFVANAASVPEPGSWVLGLIGIAAVLGLSLRRPAGSDAAS